MFKKIFFSVILITFALVTFIYFIYSVDDNNLDLDIAAASHLKYNDKYVVKVFFDYKWDHHRLQRKDDIIKLNWSNDWTIEEANLEVIEDDKKMQITQIEPTKDGLIIKIPKSFSIKDENEQGKGTLILSVKDLSELKEKFVSGISIQYTHYDFLYLGILQKADSVSWLNEPFIK